MSWTEERVDTLKKLWHDGESASIIARKIGETTRNAVIGKVHRLGLAGRATASRNRSPRPGSLFPAIPQTHKARAPRRTARDRPPPVSAEVEPLKQNSILPELGPPPDQKITVQTLTSRHCHWPVGDPKQPDFHFCGRSKSETSGPYCGAHAAISYR